MTAEARGMRPMRVLWEVDESIEIIEAPSLWNPATSSLCVARFEVADSARDRAWVRIVLEHNGDSHTLSLPIAIASK